MLLPHNITETQQKTTSYLGSFHYVSEMNLSTRLRKRFEDVLRLNGYTDSY